MSSSTTPGRDWTGLRGIHSHCNVLPLKFLETEVFFLCRPHSSLSSHSAQPCLSVTNQSPSLCAPLLVPQRIGSSLHWVVLQGGRRQGPAETPISLWVILKWNLLFCVSRAARRLAQKETGHANKQSKCFKAAASVRSSLLFLLLQREPSHHLSISVTLWFCGNCHFPLLRFPRP